MEIDGKSGIYKWTSPSGKIYIGLAKDLGHRKKDFLRRERYTSHSKEKSVIDKAREKYSDFSQWKYEVLEYCSEDRLGEREQYWIAFYNSTDKNIGYNITSGGRGGCGVPKSAFKKGHITSPEAKKKAIETRNRHIEEGVVDFKDRMKSVVAYTLDGVLYGIYESVKECNEALGINFCKKNHRCGNYIIRYATDDNPMFIEPYKKTKVVMSDEAKEKMRQKKIGIRHPAIWKPIIGINIKTREEVRYPSIMEAAIDLHSENIKAANKNIQGCCKGRRTASYGYNWRYA